MYTNWRRIVIMKFNTLKPFLLILFVSLALIGTAAAAEEEHTTGESFLQTQVDSMDPVIQPYAQLVADNIVSIFLFSGAVFLLYDGIMTSMKRKKGRTTEAAEHKNDTIETAKQLGLALILFGVFVAVVKSKTLGLV
jgi:hypothetical protein